ncbi:MAG: DUF1697 domain-containing protein [Chloroflexi bacterium]|nr:MAG: DUF1697 domain-containing protein [Chloroflexota bacterium]
MPRHVVLLRGINLVRRNRIAMKELRAAIETGTTVARRRRYRAMGLMRYAAWGLNHQRYAVG